MKQIILKIYFGLLIIFSFGLLIPVSIQAQIKFTPKNDSIKAWKIKLNPRLSPVFSAVVPGLGQIYNRKIWKVPIIYGGFYGLYYSWNYNNKKYRDFYYASVSFPDKLTDRGFPYNGRYYTIEQLQKSVRFYKRYRNLSLIGLIGWYGLNIIDASIDAYTLKFSLYTDEKIHSPQRAAVLSAAVPGLGQLYNKKLAWLKVPVIYAGFVGFYFSWNLNNRNFETFNNVYKNIPNNAPVDSLYFITGTINTNHDGYYVEENLYKAQEYFRRWKDLNLIFIAMLYMLNILDATVSGYMVNYDISNDLSLNIQPGFIDINSRFYGQQTPIGLKLTFKF